MIPVQGVYPRRQEARTDRCVHTCFSTLFTVTKRWKPPRVHWCVVDKPDVIHPWGGALFSLQKGRRFQHKLQHGWTWELYTERRKLTQDEQCVIPLPQGSGHTTSSVWFHLREKADQADLEMRPLGVRAGTGWVVLPELLPGLVGGPEIRVVMVAWLVEQLTRPWSGSKMVRMARFRLDTHSNNKSVKS